MRPLRKFEEFLEDGVVKKQRADLSEIISKICINDDNANYITENAYDALMELIRAKMFRDGFKSAGLNAHEAEISYLRKLGIQESEEYLKAFRRNTRTGRPIGDPAFVAQCEKMTGRVLHKQHPGPKIKAIAEVEN